MSADIHAQKILILDFGSQYTQLIARRVREVGVYSEIRAFDLSEEDVLAFNPSGIILSGGPESVAHEGSPRAPDCVFHVGRTRAGDMLWHADYGRAIWWHSGWFIY